MDSPPQYMRRTLDTCAAITQIMVKNILSQIQGVSEEIIWPDASSIFASSKSSVTFPVHCQSKANTIVSSVSSAKRQEAAAEYAATKAVLQIMSEQHREKFQSLEEEDKRIIAEQEAAALSQCLQEEKLETERKVKREQDKTAVVRKQQEESAQRKRSVEDLKREVERLENLKSLNAAKAKLQVYDESYLSVIQEPLTQIFEPANIQAAGIIKANLQDPSPREQPTVIQENTAFRDKLHAWPKITGKDSKDLRRFVDFLQGSKSAMTQTKDLNVLNDEVENQRLASKLPDWLSNRWNQKATEYQLEHKQFPDFSYFVTFLSMEASIACNSITSCQALRQSDFDKMLAISPRTAAPAQSVIPHTCMKIGSSKKRRTT
ncbi:hypothetical protein MHYP_G00029510 [Metynnis hypsauchen]